LFFLHSIVMCVLMFHQKRKKKRTAEVESSESEIESEEEKSELPPLSTIRIPQVISHATPSKPAAPSIQIQISNVMPQPSPTPVAEDNVVVTEMQVEQAPVVQPVVTQIRNVISQEQLQS